MTNHGKKQPILHSCLIVGLAMLVLALTGQLGQFVPVLQATVQYAVAAVQYVIAIAVAFQAAGLISDKIHEHDAKSADYSTESTPSLTIMLSVLALMLFIMGNVTYWLLTQASDSSAMPVPHTIQAMLNWITLHSSPDFFPLPALCVGITAAGATIGAIVGSLFAVVRMLQNGYEFLSFVCLQIITPPVQKIWRIIEPQLKKLETKEVS